MFENLFPVVEKTPVIQKQGRVRQVVGQVVEATGPRSSVGQTCIIKSSETNKNMIAEVVGFRDDQILLIPYDEVSGISPGDIVTKNSHSTMIPVGPELLGRVLDGLGRPIDGKGPIHGKKMQPIHNTPPDPLDRRRITQPLFTG
ncbi:MAG: EscN/YscN/HrcN family type III secretion system ATPase, partial [Candidatus Marinimicrobia bacterium]|nr:EscN/YscN/HrcN family type III secretion system ATPase [Candidatus Neomarinimicrobiota bacterium]